MITKELTIKEAENLITDFNNKEKNDSKSINKDNKKTPKSKKISKK